MNNTEREITTALYRMSDHRQRYECMIPNCFNSQYHDNEADLFAIRKSGLSDEFEIKVSRSDLLADKKKIITVRPLRPDEYMNPERFAGDALKPNEVTKYDALQSGFLPVNYFWYAIKDGIGGLEDIPKFAGLITVSDWGYCKVIRHPEKLKAEKLTAEQKYQFARKLYFRFWDLRLAANDNQRGNTP